MRIFFSGPLTHLPDPESTKKFYLSLASVATKHGFDWYWGFLRKKNTDPEKDLTPSQIYRLHTDALRSSDLVVCCSVSPSVGIGIEIECAYRYGIPVCLMYSVSDNVSKMLLGHPAVCEMLVYRTPGEGLRMLAEFLASYGTS